MPGKRKLPGFLSKALPSVAPSSGNNRTSRMKQAPTRKKRRKAGQHSRNNNESVVYETWDANGLVVPATKSIETEHVETPDSSGPDEAFDADMFEDMMYVNNSLVPTEEVPPVEQVVQPAISPVKRKPARIESDTDEDMMDMKPVPVDPVLAQQQAMSILDSSMSLPTALPKSTLPLAPAQDEQQNQEQEEKEVKYVFSDDSDSDDSTYGLIQYTKKPTKVVAAPEPVIEKPPPPVRVSNIGHDTDKVNVDVSFSSAPGIKKKREQRALESSDDEAGATDLKKQADEAEARRAKNAALWDENKQKKKAARKPRAPVAKKVVMPKITKRKLTKAEQQDWELAHGTEADEARREQERKNRALEAMLSVPFVYEANVTRADGRAHANLHDEGEHVEVIEYAKPKSNKPKKSLAALDALLDFGDLLPNV